MDLEKINVSEITTSIAQFRTLSTAALQNSAKDLYQLAGFVLGKPVSSSFWEALTMNGISCTQPTRRRQRVEQCYADPFKWYCVASGAFNCVNLNNMTHTQTRPTRALGSNIQHDVQVSRNGANHNNLINVQSNKWDLPTIININIRGALASKID